MSQSSGRMGGMTSDDIFSKFFDFDSSGSAVPRKAAAVEASDDFFSTFGCAVPRKAAAVEVSDGFFSTFGGAVPRKAAAMEVTLPCSLEDLYKGTTKKMKISRNVFGTNGRPTKIEEFLSIEIRPGWKKGTKITFAEKGDEQPGFIPSDLVIIIDEKPHGFFTRDGNDLLVTKRVLLVEALTGYTAQITTLDGRGLTIPINSIISPTYEEVVIGEGMPISKEPGRKGNLRIKFNVKFPTRLAPEQKTVIKQSLTSPGTST